MSIITGSKGLSISNTPLHFCNGRITFFGDSITAGLNASTSVKKYSTLMCSMLTATENNLAEQGATMEDRIPDNPLGIPDMISRISQIPTYLSSRDGLIVFAFGMNDWGSGGVYPAYNPTNYIADYTTVLNAVLAKGWPLGRILLLTPSYPLDAAFSFYGNYLGGTPPTRNQMLAFVAACETVASNFGVMCANLYLPMSLANYATMITSEGVHPNDIGHLFIANTIYTYLTS